MGISVKNRLFHLSTRNTSYIFCVCRDIHLVHLYWGERLKCDDIEYTAEEFFMSRANAFSVPTDETNQYFTSDLQYEFSVVGGGDYRTPTFAAKYANGSTVSEFKYESYKLHKDKPKLNGMPATYSEGDSETLEIVLKDALTGLEAHLYYTVFENYDIITRSIKYVNTGSDNIVLTSCQSATVDFGTNDFKVMNLNGDWMRESNVEWQELGHTIINIDSKRGMSSHMRNPFIAVADKNTDEYQGEVYAMTLVYSGDFSAVAEGDSCGGTRMSIGINPFGFEWNLNSGDEFNTPEAILVYSNSGLNDMSRRYHKIIRERLANRNFRDVERPMVANHFDGTHFDFDEDKLLDIASRAKEAGYEMFVLDDGWFGKRNDDRSSLGDWYVNREKLPNGLDGLAKRINDMGMKFGLWIEPEMISPDSDLYRAHPDWCIHADGRRRTENRQQLVLDLSRDEICDYLIGVFTGIIESANIEYIKWDCNRNITETANCEQKHRYVLGLYKILEALTSRFPNVLFEGCSGGGGRFDAGMLYYMPQTWTSDNTNPISRIKIQYGTSMVYPPITMAAHVGMCDAGYDKENMNMHMRAMVAMAGTFGYEMDLTKLSETELNQAKDHAKLYKSIRHTIQFGDFYRLISPFEGGYASWQFVDDEKSVVFWYKYDEVYNGERIRMKLKGLDPDAEYECNGKTYSGEVLMKLGIRLAIDKNYVFDCLIYNKK